MQIHEIFQKKRVNEGALGSIAGGVASQLASTASQKVLGTDVFDKTGQDRSMGPESEQRARNAAKSMIPTQAATNEKLWNQAVASVMQQAGAPSADQLDSASKQRLTDNLLKQLHSNFLQNKIKDYKQLPTVVNPPQPPSQTPPADRVVASINAALDSIASLANMGNTQASKQDWLALATSAYDALALLQFHSKENEVAQTTTGVADPKADALMKASGMSAPGLVGMATALKKSGEKINPEGTGSPSMDALLRAAKLL